MSGPQGAAPTCVAARAHPLAVVTKVERETGVAKNSSGSPNSERQRRKVGPILGVPPTLLLTALTLTSPQPADGWGDGGRHLRCVQDGEKKLRCGCPVLGAAKRC